MDGNCSQASPLNACDVDINSIKVIVSKFEADMSKVKDLDKDG